MSTKTGRKRLSLSEALIDNQFDNVALEQGNWAPRRNKNPSKKNCAHENKQRTNVIRSRACAYLWPYYRDLIINDWDQEPSLLFALHSPIQQWLCVHLWPSGHQH